MADPLHLRPDAKRIWFLPVGDGRFYTTFEDYTDQLNNNDYKTCWVYAVKEDGLSG